MYLGVPIFTHTTVGPGEASYCVHLHQDLHCLQKGSVWNQGIKEG